MLAAVAVGAVNLAIPLPRAGVHGIILLAAAKETLYGQERKKGRKEEAKAGPGVDTQTDTQTGRREKVRDNGQALEYS